MRTERCITWLKTACVITFVVGMIAAAGSTASTDGLWLWTLDLLDWPLDNDPAAFSDETFAVNAVLGGVMVGWAALMYAVASGPLSRGDTELVGPMIGSLLAWFVVDSTGSLLADLAGNVVLNVGFLVMFLTPLGFLRSGSDPGARPRSGAT